MDGELLPQEIKMAPESDPDQTETTDDLQFDTAEPVANTAVPTRSCIGCKRPITDTYYAVRGNAICAACRAALDAPLPGSEAGRAVKAIATGVGAGLVGALIWWAIRHFAHLQLGLVAVMVGFMVGNAVRKASGNRGGVGYQLLAVAVTYFCIAANWLPDVFEAVEKSSHQLSSTQVAHLAEWLLKRPFRGSAIGILIVGFALWEAWKLNTPRSLSITGPYQVGTGLAPGAQL
jgi:hypothetical protein